MVWLKIWGLYTILIGKEEAEQGTDWKTNDFAKGQTGH